MNQSRSAQAPRTLWVLALVLALGMVMLVAPAVPSGAQEDATQTPTEAPTGPPGADGGNTLTWSVRPTPTDDQPERPNFSFDVVGGDTVTDSIRVRNFGEEPLGLAIYASDAITTSSGALDLLPADQEPTDVGAWIVMATDQLEVPPGEAVDVPFTMTVPDNAEPGDHTGGIVTSYQSTSEDEQGQAVVLDRRLGSRVQVRVDGQLAPTLAIQDLVVTYDGSLNPFATGTATVAYTVANTGNVRLAADQRVVVPGRFGVPGREVTPEPLPELLPGNSLSFEVEVPAVWPTFRTTATVELDALPVRDGDTFDVEPFSASGATSSIPWGQLALLVLLLAVVGGMVWSRRRRRAREEAIREQARAEVRAERGPIEPLSDPDEAPVGPTPDESRERGSDGPMDA